MDLQRTLDEIASFLEENDFGYALIGGLAMQSHGLARFTSDVDLMVVVHAQESLVAFMERGGFETLHRSAGYSNHVRSSDGSRVDFVYVDEATASQVFGRAQRIAGRAPVAAAEHLIAMKVLAMTNDRSRVIAELGDIEHLMARPGVDLTEVREYFERNGQLKYFDELKERLDR